MNLLGIFKALAKKWKDEGEPQAAGVIEKSFELQQKAPELLGQAIDGAAALAVAAMPDSTDEQKALKDGLKQFAKTILGSKLLLTAAQGK